MTSSSSVWDFYKPTVMLDLIRIVHYLHIIRRILRYSASTLLSDSWRTCNGINVKVNVCGQLDKAKLRLATKNEINDEHRPKDTLHWIKTNRSIDYRNDSCMCRRTNSMETHAGPAKIGHCDCTKIYPFPLTSRYNAKNSRSYTSTQNNNEVQRLRIRSFKSRRTLQSSTKNLFIFSLGIFSLSLKCAIIACNAFSIKDVIRGGGKRTAGIDAVICPTWHPFQCPNGDCIPIKYLCDGSPDCSDEYDEDKRMCTAAVRPPVEETAAFLRALLSAHGHDFLVKLFGAKAKDEMRAMGGVDKVAVAISQSPTIESFGSEMRLKPNEIERLADVLESIISGATSELTHDEAGDFRFFVEKLQETGFF